MTDLSGDVRLGGRLFNVVRYEECTALNEHYIMKLIRETGLDKVLPLASAEESDEAYMMRVHAAVVDTLKLSDFLAGYLLPASKTERDWSLAMAAETSAFMKALTDREDKAEMHRLGLVVTFDFFRAGLDSLRHSRSALETLKIRASAGRNETTTASAAH